MERRRPAAGPGGRAGRRNPCLPSPRPALWLARRDAKEAAVHYLCLGLSPSPAAYRIPHAERKAGGGPPAARSVAARLTLAPLVA